MQITQSVFNNVILRFVRVFKFDVQNYYLIAVLSVPLALLILHVILMRPVILLSLACLALQFSSNVFHKQHDIHINGILFLFLLLLSLNCTTKG